MMRSVLVSSPDDPIALARRAHRVEDRLAHDVAREEHPRLNLGLLECGHQPVTGHRRVPSRTVIR